MTKRRNRTVQGDGRASGPRRGKRRPDQIASRLQGAKGKQKGHAKRSSEWEREVQGMTEGEMAGQREAANDKRKGKGDVREKCIR